MRTLSNVPIIVGSAPSSGSTLLINLLGRVHGIYRTDELSIFDKPDWLALGPAELSSAWRSMLRHGYRRRLACEMRPVFTGLPCTMAPAPNSGEGYLEFMLRYMDALAQRNYCRRWAEKTPANVFSVHMLVHRMPDAKFVLITRDARAVIASLLKRGYGPVLSVARWYLSNLMVNAICDHPSVLKIRYEDLVISPVETTNSLMEFIGERFAEDMLAPVGNQKPVASWSASPAGGIQTTGLWSNGASLDDNVLSAFSAMRVTPKQAEKLGLGGRVPTPRELQLSLGYPELAMPVHRISSLENRLEISVAVTRYISAMMYHKLRPRQIPFTLDGDS